MALITINGISIDPDLHANEIHAAGLDDAAVGESDYILVQSGQPLSREQRDALAEAGAQILSREQTSPAGAGATYLCRYPAASIGPVAALPFVSSAISYPRQVKVAPELLTADGSLSDVQFSTHLSPQADLVQEPRNVSVVLQPDANGQDAVAAIASAARLDSAELRIEGSQLRLRVMPRYLTDIASIDAVHHIEEYQPAKIFNDVAGQIVQAPLAHARHFEGQGQVVAVCDTGFDTGSAATPHPAFTGRVRQLYAIGRASADDPDGHGTHVAGSVLGDGMYNGIPLRGTAPAAQLVLQSVLDGGGDLALPPDLATLFREPYLNDGACIHTNSWGANVYGRYTFQSGQVDKFVWENRDCLICFAAGNAGADWNSNGVVDSSSIAAPATAKNCLAVGASESKRDNALTWGFGWPLQFPAVPISSDQVANNPDGMAAFSGRGPTKDGRLKPDLVAPGTCILSARSRRALDNGDWGASADSLYMYLGGTSMATPLVAGAAAVVRQYLQEAGRHKPSAALLKAMLINGAEDLAGQYLPSEAAAIPNSAEGFGRLNMQRSIAVDDKEQILFFDEDIALDTGEEHRVMLTPPAWCSTVKVTLVWTDPPGASLQNDLDLIVSDATGVEQHGNRPPGATAFDRQNNVEQVEWSGFPAGGGQVVVRAYDTPVYRQSFALVVRYS